MFSAFVCEQLRYYVYLLLDNREVFYIGKGIGNRAFDHARGVVPSDEVLDSQESLKLSRIRSILADHRSVEVVLLRHNLSEREAFLVESVLLDLFSKHRRIDLTNLVGGHHAERFGYMTSAEVIQTYDAPMIDLDESVPLLLLKIPKLWYRGMEKETLFEATRGWWRLNIDRAKKVEYVMAVSRGVVREVYVPSGGWRPRERGEPGWTPAELKRPRYGFDGEVASSSADRWRHRSVAHVFTNPRRPEKFVGC